MKGYLIEVSARDGVGDPLTLRFASHDDAGLCHHDQNAWWPAIAKLPTLGYDFFDGGFRGDITTSGGSFSVSMQALPTMSSAIWSDAAISIYQADLIDYEFARPILLGGNIVVLDGKRPVLAKGQLSGLTQIFSGRVRSQPRFSGGVADIEFESDSRWLDEPLLETYAGTGGVEGPDELEGSVKPLLLGSPRFAPGVLVDAVDNVYQLSAYGTIQAVEAVYDRLSSLGPSSGDHASLAALLAATIANGSWATCLALGLVRLGAPPDGQVSFHVSGDKVNGWARLPGEIVARIANMAGGVVSSTSLAAINVSRPYNLSVAITDQITARELIQSIAASIKAVAGVSWMGELFLAPVGIGAATKTLNTDGSALPPVADVQQLPVDPPFWRLATEAEKTWVVHGDADIAYQYNFRGVYSGDRVYRLDDVVSTEDGSTWRFIAASPAAGSLPTDANTDWERRGDPTVVDFDNVTGSNKPEDGATRNRPRGNYAAGTSYAPGDSVVWTVASGGTGHNYTRIGAGDTTGVAPSDGTKWALTVERGEAGADGADGADGAAGLNSAVVFIYQRAASAPDVPSTTATFTFATGAITGLNNGWSATVPAGSNPLFVATASASSTGPSDTIATGEWAAPVVLVQDGTTGAAGADGADGLNAATVFLYKRAASAPAVPSVTSTYTFVTGVLTGHNNGWTQSIPAGTNPIYAITAAAVGAGATDTIGTGEWSSPNIIAANGADGVDGVDGTDGKLTEFVFLRSISTPATPTGNGIPVGWYDDIPAGELPLWMSRAKQELDGTLIGAWDAPIRWSEDDQLLIVADLAAADALNPKVGQRALTPNGTIYRRVSSTGIILGTTVVTLGGFRPALKWTAEAEQPVVAAAKTALWSGVNGDGTPESFADVTATAQITIDPLTPFDIQANSSGETTSALPQSRTVKVRKGGVLLTSGVSFSQNSVSAGLTITVGASTGVIDLTAAPVAGAIIIDVVYGGVTYQAAILVNRTKAAAITGGAAGSSQFIDDEWTNISALAFVQVTDTGAKVQSNASGELRYYASASYNGAGTAVIKAQYSLDGSSWSDFAAETSGFPSVAGTEPEPGYVAIAAATKTGLSASTDYFVRLVAKRSAGSGTLSWFGAGFTIKQP